MAANSTLPDSVTQANYWLGRALSDLGDASGARTAWQRAAAYGTIYYGQLARAALGQKSVELRDMPAWKPAEAGFEAREVVRAVRLLADNGHREMAVPLLRSLATDLTSGGELLLAARLAQSLDAAEERSGQLEEVLKVEVELSRVRGEIEQMQGRIRVLRNLSSLATLTLTLRERERFQPPTAVVANTPVSRVPISPPMPWMPNTSSESS